MFIHTPLPIANRSPPTSAGEDGEYFQHVTTDTVDKQVWGACRDKLAGTPHPSAPAKLRMLT